LSIPIPMGFPWEKREMGIPTPDEHL